LRQRNGAASAVLAFVTLLMSVVVTGQSAQGQTLTALYAFAGGADGANPSALIRDGAGNLYGTTAAGGAFGVGKVFKLDTTGNESVLHSFAFGRIPVIDGSLVAGLVLDSKGNLYGATTGLFSQCFFRSDFFACGTVYKLDAAGNYSVLVRFNLRDGAIPQARLILDAAGNLYGTTVYGGASYPPIRGTVFKVGATGGFTLLHSFTGTDGANP